LFGGLKNNQLNKSKAPDSLRTGAGIGSLGGDVEYANKHPKSKKSPVELELIFYYQANS
jgi:hypothetical protein